MLASLLFDPVRPLPRNRSIRAREAVPEQHTVKHKACLILDHSLERSRDIASFSTRPDHGIAGVDSDVLEQHYQNIAGAFEKQRETARELMAAAEEALLSDETWSRDGCVNGCRQLISTISVHNCAFMAQPYRSLAKY
jgi:hypothetical protein